MSQYKRKYDGPPIRELRHVDQDPLRCPPHKKLRKYRLEVRYETVTKVAMSKEFTSKAAMQEFRRRVEREIDKRKAVKPKRSTYWWGSWNEAYALNMDSEEHNEFRTEPAFTEQLID